MPLLLFYQIMRSKRTKRIIFCAFVTPFIYILRSNKRRIVRRDCYLLSPEFSWPFSTGARWRRSERQPSYNGSRWTAAPRLKRWPSTRNSSLRPGYGINALFSLGISAPPPPTWLPYLQKKPYSVLKYSIVKYITFRWFQIIGNDLDSTAVTLYWIRTQCHHLGFIATSIFM